MKNNFNLLFIVLCLFLILLNGLVDGYLNVAEADIDTVQPCYIEICKDGEPVPPFNAYNNPERRGVALTCGDTVRFGICTDCSADISPQQDPCSVWSIDVISGSVPAETTITQDGLLAIGADCTGISLPATIQVTATDPCNNNIYDIVEVMVSQVILSIDERRAQPGTTSISVNISLDNPYHEVKVILADIQDPGGYLVCVGCVADPRRAPGYTCTAQELQDGDCGVMFVNTNLTSFISPGTGPVMTIKYDVDSSASSDGCITVVPISSSVVDRFNDCLSVGMVSGEICFIMCGDVYPVECLPDQPNCGDGVVDIFDILEIIDFALGAETPSDCQADRADVPTGTPPYCSEPDGTINILDVLIIVDMAIGRTNCCDYYYFGSI